MEQHSYRSASNSLTARTADRTPQTFALQGDSSRTTTPSDLSAVLKYSLRQAVTLQVVSSCIPFPSGNIQKRVAFSGIIYSAPRSPNLSPNLQNGRQGQGCHNSR
ncbi:hypothetical protein AVEN_217813-1 [Araneus ventricosus]|uniref:Uncharacterized protein n=1 Tax=Araneus ventricosus TaxID=182803 RepID=A0A4Y2LTJ3_ARAVE|nr:hypothetical protein AVEN_217813-1 [Araneus ventricosus]